MKSFKKNKHDLTSRFLKYICVLLIAIVLVTPAFAAGPTSGTPDPTSGTPNPTTGTPNPTSGTPNPTSGTPGVTVTTGIKNPLSAEFGSDLPHFITSIVNFVLLVGIPIIALAIIYSGFLFVMAQGNAEKLSKAKKTLLYTLIGAALLLGAFVVANAISGTVDAVKNSDTAGGNSSDNQGGK